ncbi:MAG: bifunctional diaminohydroxyphosphoribosylaminopyrimidine deaminase/5-amino-6-(5-phosphoribosylamino)uracil reductase RibD [Planctomycetes bacterium]|nr:bifunctional diaminohydroxyphosphoribosylaminopyrimidine deaminase/5-amino-6-(5-phosphoribosylamino)uracil reductase RibD [Planctomycetota bacterium]
MMKALNISKKGAGKVEPGPLVGAVLVKNNKIINEACYRSDGSTHAEQQLLTKNSKTDNCVLFVSLEPCVMFPGKRTPSCAELIISSGIKKVIIAMKDPYYKVSGKGIKFLQKNGVNVEIGVCESEAKVVNSAYIKYVTKKAPYVIAKWAMSVDGKICTYKGESKWITNEKSRLFARELRSKCQAVVVGIETVLKDNPRLYETDRVIFDSNLRIPLNSNIIKSCKKILTFVACTRSAPKSKFDLLTRLGVNVIRLNRISIKNVLLKLAELGISKVMIEGGGEVLGSAFEEGCVDEIYAFVAGKLIGGRDAKTPVEGRGVATLKEALQLKNIEITNIGTDILLHAFVRK